MARQAPLAHQRRPPRTRSARLDRTNSRISLPLGRRRRRRPLLRSVRHSSRRRHHLSSASPNSNSNRPPPRPSSVNQTQIPSSSQMPRFLASLRSPSSNSPLHSAVAHLYSARRISSSLRERPLHSANPRNRPLARRLYLASHLSQLREPHRSLGSPRIRTNNSPLPVHLDSQLGRGQTSSAAVHSANPLKTRTNNSRHRTPHYLEVRLSRINRLEVVLVPTCSANRNSTSYCLPIHPSAEIVLKSASSPSPIVPQIYEVQ